MAGQRVCSLLCRNLQQYSTNVVAVSTLPPGELLRHGHVCVFAHFGRVWKGGGAGRKEGGARRRGDARRKGMCVQRRAGKEGGSAKGGGVCKGGQGGGAKEGGRGLGTALTTCPGSQGNSPALFPYVGMMNTTQCKGSKKKTALLHMHVLMQVRTCCFLVVVD